MLYLAVLCCQKLRSTSPPAIFQTVSLEGVWKKGKHHLNTTISSPFVAKTGKEPPPRCLGATFIGGRGFPKLPLETVRKVAEAVSGRCVLTDIDMKIGLLCPFSDPGPPRFEAHEAFRTVSLGSSMNSEEPGGILREEGVGVSTLPARLKGLRTLYAAKRACTSA
jgi:hypothetical protein